jgi:hypothetical protein
MALCQRHCLGSDFSADLIAPVEQLVGCCCNKRSDAVEYAVCQPVSIVA